MSVVDAFQGLADDATAGRIKDTVTVTFPTGKTVTIEVRPVSAGTQGRWAAAATQKGAQAALHAYAVNMVIEGSYDPETSERLFTGAHRGMLMKVPSGVIQQIANKIGKVSGFEEDLLEEAKLDFSETP